MTIDEALREHKKDCRRCRKKACMHDIDCLQKKDIEAYEELQQYRELGTIEEILNVFNTQQAIIATQHETCKQYVTIGTVEEFKTLKEKSVAEKPDEMMDLFSDIEYNCRVCGQLIEKNYYAYCPTCGQRLDWRFDKKGE